MANCVVHGTTMPDGIRPPRRGSLARAMEQREVKRREQEASRSEVERFYKEQRALEHAAGDPFKEDLARKQREARERAKEAQVLDSLVQAETVRELAAIRTDEEEKVTNALARRQHAKDRREKELQQLKEQSAELRELAEKIRAARVNKERAAQLSEKAELTARQSQYDAAFNAYVEANDAAAVAREAEYQARRRAQAVHARHVLEEQIDERMDLVRQAELEAARERAMVDEVVRRIAEEDAASLSLKRARQEDTKAYIAQFLKEQQEAKRAAREAAAAEDRKIQDYWAAVRARDAEEAAAAAARREAADNLYERVKREMEAKEQAREREEELINLLRQEELEDKRRQEDEARRRRADALRQEMMRANQEQMRRKEEREAELKREEEAFRARMMAKFAEDDRLEQLNAQKRRMKQVEHAREVQRLIEERRRLYEEQKARDEADAAAITAEEARKAALLEVERKALLREAAELRDFLPRGVIRDQADLDYINSHLATLQVQGTTGRTGP